MPRPSFRHAGWVALASLALLGSVSAQSLRLRAEAIVSSDTISLGQLVEGLEKSADIAIFKAPAAGAKGTIRADRILQAARELGVSGINTDAITSVAVFRPARTISRLDMENRIAESLAEQNPGTEFSIALDENIVSRTIDAARKDAITVTLVAKDPRSGHFEARLAFANPTPGDEAWLVTGTLSETQEIAVPAADLDRGDAISAKDLVLVKRPVNQLSSDIVKPLSDLVGLVPRRVLRAGVPIRNADVAKPILVEKNQLVTVVYQSKGISLAMRGRASASAARGETVRVQNLQSKRFVEGIATDNGQVTVTGPAVQPANLAENSPRS